MYLEVSLGIVSLLLITSIYVIWNLMRKTQLLETWVENFTQMIETEQTELAEIDAKGSFETDDEVGQIFNQIKTTVKQLESYKGEEE